MLTRKDKKDKFQSFIKSEHFGIDTFRTIYLFNQNALYCVQTIDLYGLLIKKLDNKDIPNNFKESHLVRIKQIVILDVLMKMEILIESTLALIEGLSKGYSSVPVIMTRYKTKVIYDIIEHIKNKEYDMSKVLGLPNIDSLPISNEEKNFLSKLFSLSCESMYKSLLKIIDFYQEFSLIYNKTKHGLTFELGLSHTLDLRLVPKHPIFTKSMVQAIDKIDENKMPPGYIRHIPKPNNTIKGYYNAFAVVTFRKELFKKIRDIKSLLKQIISYTCESHLTYAMNCGETYIHFSVIDGQVGPRYFSNELSTDESARLVKIFKKIVSNMNIDLSELKTVYEFKSSEIAKSIQDNIVTNIWVREYL